MIFSYFSLERVSFVAWDMDRHQNFLFPFYFFSTPLYCVIYDMTELDALRYMYE